LEKIFLELRALVNRSRPQVVAIENVFHGRSFDSALKLGQARGVVMLAAQLATLAIYEFAPTQVKKGVTGNGGASKEQVQRMVCRILKLRERPASMDVSDALAVAFCCAEELGRCERLGADVVAGSSSRSGAGGKRRGAARIEALVKSGRARWVAPGGGASPRGTPKGGPAAGKE
jgi:crossover junction endodeoxyribonuclease RuvC